MRTAAAALAIMLLASPARAGEDPSFEHLVLPLRVEGGPILSPPLGPVPRTEIWASGGLLYGREDVGRATYDLVASRLVLGGEWSPRKIPRLGLGGQLVIFQTTSRHTLLPPVIDEWTTFADLGPLHVHARYRAFEMARGLFELGLTPFLRLGFPTDTSRIREFRHMPIRGVLDDRVMDAPYFLIEPGVSFGLTLGPASFYTHQAPVIAPIHGEATHFLWSMHYGVGVDILGVVDLALEIAGLLRSTRGHQEDPSRDRAANRLGEPYLVAFAVCPGVRLKRGDFTYEIGARVGVTPDAYDAYGDFTIAFSMAWVPGRGET